MEVDLAQFKVQLRSCATRLQHAQSKLESYAQVSKREISTLLRQEQQQRSQAVFHQSVDDVNARAKAEDADRTLEIARQKAEKIMSDDRKGQIMNILERSCDILTEIRVLPPDHQDLNQDSLRSVCAIIEGAPRVDAKELHLLRDVLSDYYDPLTSAAKRQPYVHAVIIRPLTRPPQHEVDAFLISIAQAYDLEWQPPYPLPEQRLRWISELFDTPTVAPAVDLDRLKSLCAMGLPEQPPWIRPRVWRLLLGLLPPETTKWSYARRKSRTDYISLAGPILTSVTNLPPSPTSPQPMDKYLVQFSKDIESLPPTIRQALDDMDFNRGGEANAKVISDEDSLSKLLQNADAVSKRLESIRSKPGVPKSPTRVPSITLESDPTSPSASAEGLNVPATLLVPNGKAQTNVWETILLRLLHLHCVLHASYGLPEGPSGSLVAILGVLLAVFSSDAEVPSASPDNEEDCEGDNERSTREIDAEAETFWAMEAIVGGLREALEEETDPTVDGWNKKFSRMLKVVDAPLWEDLRKKSLDPALPYYSFRWIPTLFTHTLPLNDLLPIWDALFTLPQFSSNPSDSTPPQVTFLLDIGTVMLTRARVSLFRLGKSSSFGPRSIWAEEQFALPSSSAQTPSAYSPVGSPRPIHSPSSTAWGRLGGMPEYLLGGRAEGEMGEAFLKGVKMLQNYNMDEFGGIERLLEGAWLLYAKRTGERPPTPEPPSIQTNLNGEKKPKQIQPTSTFGKFTEAVWKGITNDVDEDGLSPSPSPTVPPSPGLAVPRFTVTAPSSKSTSAGLGARIRDTVWKGVTNEVDSASPSPDASPEPSPIASRSHSPLLIAEDETEHKPAVTAGWFGGFGGSNAAAVLSKTSTNLRVRAIDMLSRGSKSDTEALPQTEHSTPGSPASSRGSWTASLAAFAQRGSFGLGAVPENGHPQPFDGPRRGSLPMEPSERDVFASRGKHDSYSPPPRPTFFRPARDSFLPTASPYAPPSPSISETSPSRGNAIQSALVALTGSSVAAPATSAKKSGPKPLLLNSRSLVTAHPSHSRTPSRTVSPVPPGTGSHRTSMVSSSSRNSSIDQFTPGASGVVSLRRGQVTSPRMVGGPNAGRAARNPRDSISSTGSTGWNQYHESRLSVDETPEQKPYSFGRTKNPGFIMDRGQDSPITVGNRDSTSTGTSGARTSPPQSVHLDDVIQLNDPAFGERDNESANEGNMASVLLTVDPSDGSDSERLATVPQPKLRTKRYRDAKPPELTVEAERTTSNKDHLAAPPSAGYGDALEPGIAYDDATPLATTPTTPNTVVGIERKGATLSRSRTPRAVRRPRKGTEDGSLSPTSRPPRKNSNPGPTKPPSPGGCGG